VFSITDRESFEAVDKWKRKVEENCGAVVMALVANKSDLEASAKGTTEEVEALARRLGLQLFRTCVKDNVNVSQVFEYLAGQYILRGGDTSGVSAVAAMGDYTVTASGAPPAPPASSAAAGAASAGTGAPSGGAGGRAEDGRTASTAAAAAAAAAPPAPPPERITADELDLDADLSAPPATNPAAPAGGPARPPAAHGAFKLTKETKDKPAAKRGWC